MASRPTSGTSSRSSTSSEEGADEVRAHSAVHVIKGAVVSVLGPRKFVFANSRVLRFRGEVPLTQQEAGRIEAAANRKVAEDAEILEFEMDRQEAEGHFGTAIYDVSPPPEERGALVGMVRIPEWETSCCGERHVESTGSIGAMRVEGASFDEGRKEAELRFHLL